MREQISDITHLESVIYRWRTYNDLSSSELMKLEQKVLERNYWDKDKFVYFIDHLANTDPKIDVNTD